MSTTATATASHQQAPPPQESFEAKQLGELIRGLAGSSAVASRSSSAAAAAAGPGTGGGGPPKDIKSIILELLVQVISVQDSGKRKEIGDLLVRVGTLLQQDSMSRNELPLPESQGT